MYYDCPGYLLGVPAPWGGGARRSTQITFALSRAIPSAPSGRGAGGRAQRVATHFYARAQTTLVGLPARERPRSQPQRAVLPAFVSWQRTSTGSAAQRSAAERSGA
jgi:hypothetical protein